MHLFVLEITVLYLGLRLDIDQQESLALASMARDDPPASSTASGRAASSTAAVLQAPRTRGKVGSEFET